LAIEAAAAGLPAAEDPEPLPKLGDVPDPNGFDPKGLDPEGVVVPPELPDGNVPDGLVVAGELRAATDGLCHSSCPMATPPPAASRTAAATMAATRAPVC